MNRSDLIGRMVLNAICDDYENVDQVILRDVAKNGAKLGLAVERSDIVAALAALLKEGLAKAYFLSATGPARELEGMPSLEVVEQNFKTYFYITKNGMDLHRSDDTWWSFDDEVKRSYKLSPNTHSMAEIAAA